MAPTTPPTHVVRLGTPYGGWWVPISVLTPASTCYLAGVGEDASFDLALIERIGCEVWAFDPTPRAITYATGIAQPAFHFVPIGLWSQDTELRFYAPRDPSHVSHSATNEQHTSTYFSAQVKRVSTVMAELGHNRLDLLKMDIEGAETEVISDLLENGPLPRVLCVEFDAHEPVRATTRRVKSLKAAGYVVIAAEGRNLTMVRPESPSK